MPVSTNFNKVDYTIAGDSFIFSAKDLSVQNTKNMFVIPSPNTNTPAAVVSYPGLKLWSAGSASEYDRGIYKKKFKSKGWKVSGNTLYSFDNTGTQTNEGTVPGSSLVSMAASSSLLFIVSDGAAFTHNGTTLTALALPFTPVQVDILNDQFIALSVDGIVYFSTAGTTDFSTSLAASSLPSNMQGIKVFNQFLLMMGTNEIEPWENTGSGEPPVELMTGAIIEDVGLANSRAMCETSDALFFLGDDSTPYAVVNFQAKKIDTNNPGISEIFASYDTSSCFVGCVKVLGQDIIIFTFPVDGKCWIYSQDTALWAQLDHDVDGQLYLGKTYARLFGKTLVGDRTNGDIYELDHDTYQNDSTVMIRERVFRPMSGETVQSARAFLQMKLIQFSVETGVGTGSDNPAMMVSYSVDGGRTYSNERWVSLGGSGDYQELVEDSSNRKFKDLVVRIRYAESTRFSLYNAAIFIRDAGR
jgi:hypothetical protein